MLVSFKRTDVLRSTKTELTSLVTIVATPPTMYPSGVRSVLSRRPIPGRQGRDDCHRCSQHRHMLRRFRIRCTIGNHLMSCQCSWRCTPLGDGEKRTTYHEQPTDHPLTIIVRLGILTSDITQSVCGMSAHLSAQGAFCMFCCTTIIVYVFST